MLNLDNSELIHAAGSAWNNHKYIKKSEIVIFTRGMSMTHTSPHK